MNDYSGMLLHEARLQDQIKEARRSQLLAERRIAGSAMPGQTRRRRVSRVLWAIALALLAALRITSG